MDWKASSWIWPWFGGLALISWQGQFGGGARNIGFWWDLVILTGFSLAIYYLAVGLGMDSARVAEAVEEEEVSAASEPELSV